MAELYIISGPKNFPALCKDYIGATRYTAKHRFRLHLTHSIYEKSILYQSIRKHGRENFEVTVLCIGDKKYIFDLEAEAIKSYDTFPPYGYNSMSGGLRSYEFSEETRKKMSESQRKRPPPTLETRAKISQKATGRRHSEETKKRFRDIAKSRVFSEETKQRMSESSKGMKHSKETKKKMSESIKKWWAEKKRGQK